MGAPERGCPLPFCASCTPAGGQNGRPHSPTHQRQERQSLAESPSSHYPPSLQHPARLPAGGIQTVHMVVAPPDGPRWVTLRRLLLPAVGARRFFFASARAGTQRWIPPERASISRRRSIGWWGKEEGARAVAESPQIRQASTKMICRLTSDGSSHLGARSPDAPRGVSLAAPVAPPVCSSLPLPVREPPLDGPVALLCSVAARRSRVNSAQPAVGDKAAEVSSSSPRVPDGPAWPPPFCVWCLSSGWMRRRLPSTHHRSEARRACQHRGVGAAGGATR